MKCQPHLHDLCSELVAVSQSACQHGLGEFYQQGDEIAHAIARMRRGGHQRHESAYVLILIEQSCIQTLCTNTRSFIT